MSNIYDYLHWRGDISFAEVGMREADYTIFAWLSYIPFDKVIDESFTAFVSLGEAMPKVLEYGDPANEKYDGRVYTNGKNDEKLMQELENCPRFANLKVCGYVNIIDERREEQFAAVTFVLPSGNVVVSYRGTDVTLVGWKEDFNLGFMSEVPAQRDAVDYLQKVAAYYPGWMYVCGHSKGGNLAMYAAGFSSDEVQDRIIAVRNMDGPGFNEEMLRRAKTQRILDRTETYLPQDSVVGMLLGHEEPYHVVHSVNVSLMQHSLHSWEIERTDFVQVEGITSSSQLVDATLKEWVRNMSIEDRGKLIDGFYAVVQASDAKTREELATGKSTLAILKALNKTDEETKEIFRQAYKLFKQSLKKSLPIVTAASKNSNSGSSAVGDTAIAGH